MSVNFLCEVPDEKRELLELTYNIYTDGSCTNVSDTDRKEGGWAAIIIDNKYKQTILQGHAKPTTNNRMELTAILEALKVIDNKLDTLTRQYATINLYTDSTYCTNTIREWIFIWEQEHFENRPNADLLRELIPLLKSLHKNLNVNWIPRNSCDAITQADRIANEQRALVV